MSIIEGFLVSVVNSSYILDKYPNFKQGDIDKLKSDPNFVNNINDILNYYLQKTISNTYEDMIEPYKRLIQFRHCKELGINPSDAKFNLIFSVGYDIDPMLESEKIILSLIDKEKLNKEISEICKNDKDIGELSIEDFNCRSEKFCKIVDECNKLNFEIGDPDRENPI